MKDDIKDIWYGLCGAAHAAWELFVDWWDIANAKQKWILIGVTAVVLLSLGQCVFAQERAHNYNLISYPNLPHAFICYIPDGVFDSTRLYDCLLAKPLQNGAAIATPLAGYCIIVGAHGEEAPEQYVNTPSWTCGTDKEEVERLMVGF